MKPRNLKQALEQGYIIIKVYNKGGKQVRVTVQERYHKPDRDIFLEFWIDRKYFQRTYPYAYK